MQTLRKSLPPRANNILHFPELKKRRNKRRPGSKFTSDGRPKAQETESIKSLEAIKAILEHFKSKQQYRNLALFIIGVSTAYRCGDLLKLKWCDFIDEQGLWKKELDIIEEKTGKRRKMEITNAMKSAVGIYMYHTPEIELNAYIFPGRDNRIGMGAPIKVSSFHKILKETGRKLNLPYNIGTHTMRKTYGYWYLQVHKNDITAIATLQEMFGHSSEKITLRYCGIAKEELRENNRHVSDKWMQLMNELK